jgi:hypothetical protein
MIVFAACHGHGTMHDHYVKGERAAITSRSRWPDRVYIAPTTCLIVRSFTHYLLLQQ